MMGIMLIIFVIQISTVHNNEISFKEKLLPKSTVSFFANFLQSFHEFHVIFHADSLTIHFVNDIIQLLNDHTIIDNKFLVSVELYNCDRNKNVFLRPNKFHIVHVLLSQSSELWPTLNSYKKINNNDVVVFVGCSSLQARIIDEASDILKLAGNVLAVELSKETTKNNTVHRICYYCGLLSMKFTLLITTNTTEMSVALHELLPNNFRNLNGHLLHTIYIQYYPFAYCQTGKVVEGIYDGKRILYCGNIKGIESNLIRTMSQKLNFSMLVHTLDSNATFFDMIKYVNSKRADFAFGGISITEDRIPFIQFSNQYNAEDYVFLYVLKLTFAEMFDKFTEPFRAIMVWTLYILSLFVLSATVYVFMKIHSSNSEQKSYGIILWAFLHTPFEQAIPGLRSIFSPMPSTMMLLGLWWWSSLIMCTLYKSSMLSAMVNPPNTEPEDIQQLIGAGYTIAGNIQYQDIVHELLNVNDPIYEEALAKTYFANNACDALARILEGGIAMLDELSEIQYELRTICPDPGKSLKDKFRVTRRSVRHTGHAWALQLGAPYRPALDYYLSLVLSGGLFIKWTSDENMRLESNMFRKSRDIRSKTVSRLSLRRLLPLLVIYSSGIGLAMISFLIEIIVDRFMKAKIVHWKQ